MRKTRKLGSIPVLSIGLGCMGMSGMYGPSDESESLATIGAALGAGVTLIDTGDFYGSGLNEMLIGRALNNRREQVILSVKFGGLRGPDGAWIGVDTRPIAVKNFLTYSLRRLGTDYIDIYRPARLDPAVPIEDTIGAIAELIQAGYVRAPGLSEVGAATISRGQRVHPIADVQLEYSVISRGAERQILPLCEQLGIGITAYGVLSRGLLTGSRPAATDDFRKHLPRFKGENLVHNQELVETLNRLAAEKGITTSQLCIAWALAKGDYIVPVIGARTRNQLADALGCLDIDMTKEEIARIEQSVATHGVAGTRHGEAQMRLLDSER